jgi:hypothetical protein
MTGNGSHILASMCAILAVVLGINPRPSACNRGGAEGNLVWLQEAHGTHKGCVLTFGGENPPAFCERRGYYVEANLRMLRLPCREAVSKVADPFRYHRLKTMAKGMLCSGR